MYAFHKVVRSILWLTETDQASPESTGYIILPKSSFALTANKCIKINTIISYYSNDLQHACSLKRTYFTLFTHLSIWWFWNSLQRKYCDDYFPDIAQTHTVMLGMHNHKLFLLKKLARLWKHDLCRFTRNISEQISPSCVLQKQLHECLFPAPATALWLSS